MDTVKRKVRALAIVILLARPTALGGREMHFGLPFLVAVDSKYGYMDANCRMVVPAQFDEAFEFTEGLAAVKAGDKWGYIDRSGKFVIAPRFAGAFHFANGLASVANRQHQCIVGLYRPDWETRYQATIRYAALVLRGVGRGLWRRERHP